MHMADALVSPVVGATMFLASGLVATYSIKKIKEEDDFKKKIPTMGVMGALVFATQMVNFTIPGTGSSGHLCGGLLLSAVLGPYAGFLSMIGVLLIQCLFFADGGLLALGSNIWNMAFYGCFIGCFIWKICMKKGISKKKIVIGSILGAIVALQLGAFSVTVETSFSGVVELPFGAFLLVMQPIHLIIGLVEGLITAGVLCFIYEARPEILWDPNQKIEKQAKFSYGKTIAILGCVVILIGGGISLFASSHPDGLEWSIEKITGNTEIETKEGKIYEKSDEIQSTTAILPDYALKNTDSILGTSISGLVGCGITIIVLMGIGVIVKTRRKKEQKTHE